MEQRIKLSPADRCSQANSFYLKGYLPPLFCNVGDTLTFNHDPQRYIVLEVEPVLKV